MNEASNSMPGDRSIDSINRPINAAHRNARSSLSRLLLTWLRFTYSHGEFERVGYSCLFDPNGCCGARELASLCADREEKGRDFRGPGNRCTRLVRMPRSFPGVFWRASLSFLALSSGGTSSVMTHPFQSRVPKVESRLPTNAHKQRVTPHSSKGHQPSPTREGYGSLLSDVFRENQSKLFAR
jgi:hypothetical protein